MMKPLTRRSALARTVALTTVLAPPWVAHAGAYDDFFAAIRKDDAWGMSNLLQSGFDPNTVNEKGVYGLMLALREGSLKVAAVLIGWPKTNVEVRTPQDENALMMAALKGYLDIAKQLIERDADVNKPGWAPLHYAATKGDVPMIELLLDNDAYIDAESPNGTTPLMMAAHYGTIQAVKALLDAGADATLKNQLDLTAIDFAQKVSRKDVAEAIAAHLRAKRPKGTW